MKGYELKNYVAGPDIGRIVVYDPPEQNFGVPTGTPAGLKSGLAISNEVRQSAMADALNYYGKKYWEQYYGPETAEADEALLQSVSEASVDIYSQRQHAHYQLIKTKPAESMHVSPPPPADPYTAHRLNMASKKSYWESEVLTAKEDLEDAQERLRHAEEMLKRLEG